MFFLMIILSFLMMSGDVRGMNQPAEVLLSMAEEGDVQFKRILSNPSKWVEDNLKAELMLGSSIKSQVALLSCRSEGIIFYRDLCAAIKMDASGELTRRFFLKERLRGSKILAQCNQKIFNDDCKDDLSGWSKVKYEATCLSLRSAKDFASENLLEYKLFRIFFLSAFEEDLIEHYFDQLTPSAEYMIRAISEAFVYEPTYQQAVDFLASLDGVALPGAVTYIARTLKVPEKLILSDEDTVNFCVLSRVFSGGMNGSCATGNLNKLTEFKKTWFTSVVVPAILQDYLNDAKEYSEYAAALVFVLKNSTMWQEKNRGQRMAALTSFCQKNPDNYRNTLSLVGKEKRNHIKDLSIGKQVLLLHLFLFEAIDNTSLISKDGVLILDVAQETTRDPEKTSVLPGDNERVNTEVNNLQGSTKVYESRGFDGYHPTNKRPFLAQYSMQLGGIFVGFFAFTYCLGALYLYLFKDILVGFHWNVT
jgi:hypothetical protein